MSVPDFLGRNPVEEAVEAIVSGSRLTNHTDNFYEVSEVYAHLVLKDAGTRFPFATALLTPTTVDDDFITADVFITIYDQLPSVSDATTRAGYYRDVNLALRRQAVELIEIAKWLTGHRDPSTGKPLYTFTQNGAGTFTQAVDDPDNPIPDDRVWRVASTTLVLPLSGSVGTITPNVFNP